MDYILLWKLAKESVVKGFSVVGLFYSLYGMLKTMFTPEAIQFQFSFVFAVCLFVLSSCFFAIKYWYDLNHKEYVVKGTQRTVSIKVGDILSCKNGTILIGINDTLESDESKVGENSIHKQLLNRYRNNHDWIKRALDDAKSQAKADSIFVNNGHYPMGFTIKATSPDGKSFAFVVMSHLHSRGGPHANSSEVSEALNNLFSNEGYFSQIFGTNCVNHRLYMPILGASVSLIEEKKHIAEKIAFQFIDIPSNYIGTHHLVIVFRPHSLKGIDLVSLHGNIASYAKRLHNPFKD